MLKKLSLRARLTLLSALVTAGSALLLTAVSMVSADRIFVQQLQQELVTAQVQYAAGAGTALPRPGGTVPDDGIRDGGWGILVSPEEPPEEGLDETGYTVAVTFSKAGKRFNLWGAAGLLLVTLLGTGATWLMAGQALRPVRELSAAIEEVSGSDLSRRVDANGRQDEVGRLTNSFNAMMDKVSASFERQKRFSASAAHELRTPLANIQLGMEVLELEERPSPARMEKALAVAKTNTERMIRLVEDLLRLSSNQQDEPQGEVSLAELCSEALGELSPRIAEKRLTVTADVPPGLRVRGSRSMLFRALFNLAENAVKYNREGGSIHLSASAGEGWAKLRVEDTGAGICAEDLEHIFEPFYRADRSRSRAMGGSGLGLTLVRDIAERHGGAVGVQSAAGEGTVFTLSLPLSEDGAV